MKHINVKYSILIALLLLCFGCSDFLEESNPNQMTTDDFWTTENDLVMGINATYRPLRFNGSYSRWLHILYVSRSDEGFSESPNPHFQSYSNFKTGSYNDASAEGVLYPWLDMWKGVFWANQVLDNTPNIVMNDDLKNQIKGEAYFLRGVQYFNIASIYGKGPLKTTAFASSGSSPEILDQNELFEQAASDFEEAIKSLPLEYDSENIGRATLGAAKGMLMKVKMQQKDWDAAILLAEDIFDLKNSGGQPLYELVNNYRDNFSASNENNKESLFEVQFDYGKLDDISLGSSRAKFMGLPGPSWADAYACKWVYDEFTDKTTDNKVDPRRKMTLFSDDDDNANELYYGLRYSKFEDAKAGYVYWKKYTNYDIQTEEDYNSGINFRVLRLADVYLMYAEALNWGDGDKNTICEYMNKVRRRVGLNDINASSFTTQEAMLDQIKHERVCELAGEGNRWNDLVRWGELDDESQVTDIAENRDEEFLNFDIRYHKLFPIPYREVSLVPIVQNAGY